MSHESSPYDPFDFTDASPSPAWDTDTWGEQAAQLPTVEKKSRLTRRRIIAAGLTTLVAAGVVSGGVALQNRQGHEQQSTTISETDPMASGEVADVLDFSVMLPEQASVEEFLPSVPATAESERNTPGYCEVVDVPLENAISLEQITEGLQTETMLSSVDLMAADESIDTATTQAEIQAIVGPIFERLGIHAVYDNELAYGYQITDQVNGEEGLTAYRIGMKQHLLGAALMPREMANAVTEINFVDAKFLSADNIAGLYQAGVISLATQYADRTTIVHEFAHALHNEACKDLSDAQLEVEYTKALQLLSADPAQGELERRFDGVNDILPDEEFINYQKYLAQGVEAGFPSAYSRTNYIELLAETSTELLAKGGYISGVKQEGMDRNSSALRIQELTIERLSKALPHTDIVSYLQAREAYAGFTPDIIDRTTIIDRQISPLDGTYLEFNGTGGTFVKAVELRSPNGDPSTYLYAHTEQLDGKDVVVMRVAQSEEQAPNIIDAASAYMEKIAGTGAEVDMTYEIDSGSNYIRFSIGEASLEPMSAVG